MMRVILRLPESLEITTKTSEGQRGRSFAISLPILVNDLSGPDFYRKLVSLLDVVVVSTF